MAIAWARLEYVQRSKGKSAVAIAAYQARTEIQDLRTGQTHDGRGDGPVDDHLIMLPAKADAGFASISRLWNAAEHAEVRKNSQTAKLLMLALPKELSLTQNIELATSFINNHFVVHGLAAQLDFHPAHDGADNAHVHVLITTRRIEGNHFASHKARDLDPEVRRNRHDGATVITGNLWGVLWREHQNEYFQRYKINAIVDPQAIYPLNRDFGPKRAWTARDHQTFATRQDLNEALARHPRLVFDALSRTGQQFDSRALNRFLEKHSVPEAVQTDIRESVEEFKREALDRELAAVPLRDDGDSPHTDPYDRLQGPVDELVVFGGHAYDDLGERLDAAHFAAFTGDDTLLKEFRARDAALDKVPSGWRRSTAEDVARELSPDYALAVTRLREAREAADQVQRALRRTEQNQIIAEYRMQERRNELGLVRNILHDKTAWRPRMGFIRRAAYRFGGDAELDQWQARYRGGGKKVAQAKRNLKLAESAVREAEAEVDRTFAEIQPKAKADLARRQQIARAARREVIQLVADELTQSHLMRRSHKPRAGP